MTERLRTNRPGTVSLRPNHPRIILQSWTPYHGIPLVRFAYPGWRTLPGPVWKSGFNSL